MHALALALAALIGLLLGLLGGGGSTLAVPILIYVAGMDVKPAIAASLVVVGTTSLVGAARHHRASNVEGRTALVFGLVSMAGSYGGGKLAARVTDRVQLMLFAAVMLAVAVSMLRRRAAPEESPSVRLPLVIAAAAVVGLLTGFVGVGGGFLIVPALVLFAGIPMKRAVGTSLLVIAMNCASGLAAYSRTVAIDWPYTAAFTAVAVAGVFGGSALVHRVSQAGLQRAFGVFLVFVAAVIVFNLR